MFFTLVVEEHVTIVVAGIIANMAKKIRLTGKKKVRREDAGAAYLFHVFFTLEMSDEFATYSESIIAYVANAERFIFIIIHDHLITCGHVVVK
ncbi:hypothetical protein N665_0498s0034, partial [Sinapis alba]